MHFIIYTFRLLMNNPMHDVKTTEQPSKRPQPHFACGDMCPRDACGATCCLSRCRAQPYNSQLPPSWPTRWQLPTACPAGAAVMHAMHQRLRTPPLWSCRRSRSGQSPPSWLPSSPPVHAQGSACSLTWHQRLLACGRRRRQGSHCIGMHHALGRLPITRHAKPHGVLRYRHTQRSDKGTGTTQRGSGILGEASP